MITGTILSELVKAMEIRPLLDQSRQRHLVRLKTAKNADEACIRKTILAIVDAAVPQEIDGLPLARPALVEGFAAFLQRLCSHFETHGFHAVHGLLLVRCAAQVAAVARFGAEIPAKDLSNPANWNILPYWIPSRPEAAATMLVVNHAIGGLSAKATATKAGRLETKPSPHTIRQYAKRQKRPRANRLLKVIEQELSGQEQLILRLELVMARGFQLLGQQVGRDGAILETAYFAMERENFGMFLESREWPEPRLDFFQEAVDGSYAVAFLEDAMKKLAALPASSLPAGMSSSTSHVATATKTAR
jgi:hypothetical protein